MDSATGAAELEKIMARFKYFSDMNGETIELVGLTQMSNEKFAQRFPSIKGMRADGYTKWVAHPATGKDCLLPVTRMIDYKKQPSLHQCNAKCLNGKHNGTCECQCGGVNHGRGMFYAEAA